MAWKISARSISILDARVARGSDPVLRWKALPNAHGSKKPTS